jgi:hypothetical protein
MAEASLILEILKRIGADTADTRRRFESFEVRMSAFEDHLRGIMTTLAGIRGDIDDLRHRFERIERRLDIVEA